MKIHAFADLLPSTGDGDYAKIRDDISANGLKVAILLFEGAILDGRTRYKACVELNMKPRFRPFYGTQREALATVASHNLYRRHLNQSQKAVVAAAVADQLVSLSQSSLRDARLEAAKATGASENYVQKAALLTEDQTRAVLNGETTIGSLLVSTDDHVRIKLNRAISETARLIEEISEHRGPYSTLLYSAKSALKLLKALVPKV